MTNVCVDMHVSAGACRSQRWLILPELVVQVVVNCLVWVLEIKFGSSGRIGSALNHGAISPLLTHLIFNSIDGNANELEFCTVGLWF